MKRHRYMRIAIVIAVSLSLGACHPISRTPQSAETPEATREPVSLSLWHIWTTDIDANRITLEAGLDAVQDAYPFIKFDVDATETETYKTRIKTSIAVNDAPDIFFSWGGGFSESFVDTGKVLCMDPYYTEEIEGALPREFLQYQTYDGSIYGFPLMRAYAILFVNQKILTDNGLAIPATYDELLSTAKVLSGKGITTIGVAGQDMWPLMFHYATLAMREMGPDGVKAALDGRSTFHQSGFIEACKKLLELKRAGAFGYNCLLKSIEPVANGFMAGSYAMYYHGSWATGGFTSSIASRGDIVPCIYPGTGGPYDQTFLGGAVDCWMGSANTAYPDEVAEAMILLAQTISTTGSYTGMALPMWDASAMPNGGGRIVPLPGYTAADYVAIKQVYNKEVELTRDVGQDESMLWWDTYLGSKGTRCNELIVQMFTEDLTPDEFAAAMDDLVAAEE